MRADGRPELQDALASLHPHEWYKWKDSKNKIYSNVELTQYIGVGGVVKENPIKEMPSEETVNAKLKELQDAWDAANGG